MSTWLTKDETVALWHAISWMEGCLRIPEAKNSEAYEVERERLLTAKQALRKVNAIRKDQAIGAKAAARLNQKIDLLNFDEREKAMGKQP